MNQVLVCTGFPRSGTSLAAQLLAEAGVPLGHNLMPSSISNIDGHFEDRAVVRMHLGLLKSFSTTWMFHDEVNLPHNKVVSEVINRYVQDRDTESSRLPWGFKDPHASLFLPCWQEVLGARGVFVVLFRHWSQCLDSLYRRHARTIAHQLPPAPILHRQAVFWLQPTLAAQMWLSYNKRIAEFVEKFPDRCILIGQHQLLEGFDIIRLVQSKIDFELQPQNQRIVKPELARGHPLEIDLTRLPPQLLDELDLIYQQLVSFTDGSAARELPASIDIKVSGAVSVFGTKRDIDEVHRLGGVAGDTADEPFPLTDPKINALAEEASPPSEERILGFLRNTLQQPSLSALPQLKALAVALAVPDTWRIATLETAARALLLYELFDEALAVALCAQKHLPTRPYLLVLVGQCHHQLQNFEEARLWFEKARELAPTDYLPLLRLGQVKMSEGEFAEGVELFKAALAANSREASASLNWIRCDLIRAYEKVYVLDEAITRAEDMYRQSGEDHTVGLEYSRLVMRSDFRQGQKVYAQLTRRFLLSKTGVRLLPLQDLLHALPDSQTQLSLHKHLVQAWREVLSENELSEWLSSVDPTMPVGIG